MESAVTLPPPTAPNVRIAQVSTESVPTQSREMQAIATSTHEATSQPTSTPELCEQSARTRHHVIATIDYAAKTLQVAQQINHINHAGVPLGDLVLNVEPNQWDGAFALEGLQINNLAVPTVLDTKKLTVTLPTPLKPGCEVQLNLTFKLNPPKVGSGVSSFRGYFGYGERQMNLAYWLPSVAPYIDGQAVIHTEQGFGEQMVLEQGDWDVSLTVNNASGDLKIAAPGVVEQVNPNTWRYVFEGARDFSVSLSEYYQVQTMKTGSGVQVEVYAFPDAVRQTASGLQDGAQHALREATNALQQYSELFGTYPHSRMLVVQADFPDGMESSSLVFVSSNWFYKFEGGFTNYLTVITVHEVAHQWWYARVGNDSALAPWLDESLTTYSEYIYYEEFHPELKNWWWDFRVGWYNPQGSVDSTVYEFTSARDYINAAYLRGAQMLHNLREDIGTEAFFKLLAEYVRAADGQIATPRLFWSLFTPAQLEATKGTRGQFLRDPDLIGSP